MVDRYQGRWLRTLAYCIVIPESLVEDIMKLVHCNVMSCHPGVANSLHKCREYFYWSCMHKIFSMFIAACATCNATKQPRAYLKAPLKHIIFHHLRDCIVIDHIVPSAEKLVAPGFRYISTITVAWSNYLVTVPVKTHTAKENVRAIFRH